MRMCVWGHAFSAILTAICSDLTWAFYLILMDLYKCNSLALTSESVCEFITESFTNSS